MSMTSKWDDDDTDCRRFWQDEKESGTDDTMDQQVYECCSSLKATAGPLTIPKLIPMLAD